MTVITSKEIKSLQSNKILSVNVRVGILANSTKYKVIKDRNDIIIVTYEGIQKYLGNAQYAYGWGVKNIHYKVFKTEKEAANFINNNI